MPRTTPNAPPSRRSSKPNPTAFSIREISKRANAKPSNTPTKTSTYAAARRIPGSTTQGASQAATSTPQVRATKNATTQAASARTSLTTPRHNPSNTDAAMTASTA
jgi:hypothetical protein